MPAALLSALPPGFGRSDFPFKPAQRNAIVNAIEMIDSSHMFVNVSTVALACGLAGS